jgi:hypothetical protein
MKLITMVLSVFMLCVTPFVSAGTQHASVVPVSAEPITVSEPAKLIAVRGVADEVGAGVRNFADTGVYVMQIASYLLGAGFVVNGVVAMFREDGKPMMSLLVGAGLMAVPSLLSYLKHSAGVEGVANEFNEFIDNSDDGNSRAKPE